jgi:large subunit ribosomal protein L21
MPYAVIRTGGKQYRVEPGDVIRVESLSGAVGTDVRFDQVLLRSTETGLVVGSPLVAGAAVDAKIVGQGRAKKIIVYKKKRRKNYRRRAGHRQAVTTIQVVSVG